MEHYRALLVDDEEDLASTLVERLGYRGFEAAYATNGADALEKLRESTFDVVVIDFKLPGMSGEDLVRTITAAYPNIPVLMVTGHGAANLEGRKKPEGVSDFLLKPIDISDLVVRMKEAIHSKGSEK
jgi:DNA-binding NtrC family response regulator